VVLNKHQKTGATGCRNRWDLENSLA